MVYDILFYDSSFRLFHTSRNTISIHCIVLHVLTISYKFIVISIPFFHFVSLDLFHLFPSYTQVDFWAFNFYFLYCFYLLFYSRNRTLLFNGMYSTVPNIYLPVIIKALMTLNKSLYIVISTLTRYVLHWWCRRLLINSDLPISDRLWRFLIVKLKVFVYISLDWHLKQGVKSYVGWYPKIVQYTSNAPI